MEPFAAGTVALVASVLPNHPNDESYEGRGASAASVRGRLRECRSPHGDGRWGQWGSLPDGIILRRCVTTTCPYLTSVVLSTIVLMQNQSSLFEFISTFEFERSAKNLLTEEDRRHLELLLLEDPRRGQAIERTGGFRKVRFGRPSRREGKSGGTREGSVERWRGRNDGEAAEAYAWREAGPVRA